MADDSNKRLGKVVQIDDKRDRTTWESWSAARLRRRSTACWMPRRTPPVRSSTLPAHCS